MTTSRIWGYIWQLWRSGKHRIISQCYTCKF